jgi:hypothetical protein
MTGVKLNKAYLQWGIHGETPLNNDLGIKNEKQDCKVGIICVWGTCGRGRVNEGD